MVRSRVCLTVSRRTIDENVALVNEYRADIDLVELRADLLDPAELAIAPTFPGRADLPVILTIRRERDGGRFDDAAERARRDLLLTILSEASPPFAYVDLEDDWDDPRFQRLPTTVRVIRSRHDMVGIPEDLDGWLDRVRRSTLEGHTDGARPIYKLAATPTSTQQAMELIRAARSLPNEVERVVVGMGVYGFPTRVLGAAIGNTFTFAGPATDKARPFHTTPHVLETEYGYRRAPADAALFAVIGHPVLHSRSPAYHNRAFADAKCNAYYIPIDVDDGTLIRDVFDALSLRGASVTVPHKAAAALLADEAEEAVQALEAANTLVRHPDGRFFAYSTDVEGFLNPLLVHPQYAGVRSALVIGAGGVARAAVYALIREGIGVIVANRTPARAEELARDLRRYAGVGRDGAQPASVRAAAIPTGPVDVDLVVQATTVGMEGAQPGDPAPGLVYRPQQIVYDLVYTPEWTPLRRRAAEAGATTISGRAMFDEQAKRQAKLFAEAARI